MFTGQPYFSITHQDNWCDSVAAAIADYDTLFVQNGNYSGSSFSLTLYGDLGILQGLATG